MPAHESPTLSDKDLLRAALGGWCYREPELILEKFRRPDGAMDFFVQITIPAAAVAKARADFAAKTGGWEGAK